MNMAEPALMRSEDGTTVPLVEVVGTARADVTVYSRASRGATTTGSRATVHA
jgi:hypothetical protein